MWALFVGDAPRATGVGAGNYHKWVHMVSTRWDLAADVVADKGLVLMPNYLTEKQIGLQLAKDRTEKAKRRKK